MQNEETEKYFSYDLIFDYYVATSATRCNQIGSELKL